MLHYPHIIRQIGPLSQVWCMRLEGKHRELKRYSNTTTSRKNLPLSLLIKQQLQFSARIVSKHGIQNNIKTANHTTIPNITGYEIQYVDYKEVKWVLINNIKYYPEQFVQTASEDVLFYKIEKCLTNNTDIIFVVNEYSTITFSKHYQAYEIKEPHILNRQYCQQDKFISLPTSVHKLENKLLIRAKPM